MAAQAGTAEAYRTLQREYQRTYDELCSERTFRQSLQRQSASQAARLGEAIADLLAAREETAIWREAYWQLATDGEPPMPRLEIVAPGGA